jgi:catechol 2,3-dioxygenase
MHDGMKLGAPLIRIRDLERTLLFYETVLGLRANRRQRAGGKGPEVLELGFRDGAEPLLELQHDSNATPTPHNFAGLYHFAILLPDRRRLARAYKAVATAGGHFDGFANHRVSDALYLHDPEHNGIEIYADRARSDWPRDSQGQLAMDTLPLDLDSLMSEIAGEQVSDGAFPDGARIGHMHLRVTNLARSVAFYQEQLGLSLTVDLSSMGAAFLAAGGYHHHIGLNTWHSRGGTPHRQGEAGLDELRIIVPDSDVLEALATQLRHSTQVADGRLSVSDPDGISIVVGAAPRSADRDRLA